VVYLNNTSVYGSVEQSLFGHTQEGIPVREYTLINKHGLMMKVLSLGGIVRELWVPDKNGRFVDVVLGFNSVEEYERNPGYLGAIIGRFANRIAYGRFQIDGVTYQLALNDGGGKRPNALHGGVKGFDKRVWKTFAEVTPEGPKVILKLRSHDGEEGYPGNLDVTVIYTLTNENEWKIEYFATADKPTIVNLTQHTYFNLNGGGKIYNHCVLVRAEKYTPVNENLIPTGEIAPVEGTSYDLRKQISIKEAIARLRSEYPNLKGFDINYVLSENHENIERFAGSVYSEVTGIRMEVYTTQPGLQFYTGNYLQGFQGKYCQIYDEHTGFCLETQHFPNSPNHENFPKTVLRPGDIYHYVTRFKFLIG
jgi:aldose 1-epimerase